MAYLQVWDDKSAKKELQKRLSEAMQARERIERQWQRNERTIFNRGGPVGATNDVSISFDSDLQVMDTPDNAESNIGTNYSLKNIRLIHAQLSANPPSVVPRPTSNDPEDRRRADASDRAVRYGMRQYNMQERQDMVNLNALIYGSGFGKHMWDKDAGEIIDVNTETGELTMEGDYSYTVPSVWNIYPDSDATVWEDVRYVFERIIMPYEQACFLFQGKEEVLKRYRIQGGSTSNQNNKGTLDKKYYDSVEIYQYWEKGLPLNGQLGRFCWCGIDGELITKVEKSPESYSVPKIDKDIKTKSLPKAVLPYNLLTDLDVPGQLWGKSSIEFASSMQDNLNRVDSVTLENIKAHGVARLILPEGAEIADDSITNSPYDVIKMTGSMPAHFMEPMPLPASMPQIRETMRAGIDDMFGVNESMFGQQSREQSGFSMQYATNQGNMIRRRLFNKYVQFVEQIYKRYLMIIQKNWDTPRTIHVLGKEKAYEAIDLKGADIEGGYDLVVEYGTSFSLDPIARREEIMTLIPLFKEAGMEVRQLLQMLKLNELPSMYDELQLAEDRQREIFEEMIASHIYIQPAELQDHKNMLMFAYRYVMTTEYKYLSTEDKALIDAHIKAREQVMAQSQASAQAPAQAAPGSVPPPAPAMAPPMAPPAV